MEHVHENTFAGQKRATVRQDDFFRQQTTAVQTTGGDVAVPIFFFEASQVLALFVIESDRAQATIGPHGFRAVEIAPGKALAAVAFYEHRRTTIGAFNEAGVAIAAVPTGMKPPRLPIVSLFRTPENNVVGFHVLNLPVTTHAACAVGTEIWGFPKFVTGIDFRLENRVFHGTVSKPRSCETLIKLYGTIGFGIPSPCLDLVLYSHNNGAILRTCVDTRGRTTLALRGSVQLDVAKGDHPMAQNLNALDLAGKKPVLLIHTRKLQQRISAATVFS